MWEEGCTHAWWPEEQTVGNSPPNPFSLFHYDEFQAGSMAALLGIVFPTSVHLERAV